MLYITYLVWNTILKLLISSQLDPAPCRLFQPIFLPCSLDCISAPPLTLFRLRVVWPLDTLGELTCISCKKYIIIIMSLLFLFSPVPLSSPPECAWWGQFSVSPQMGTRTVLQVCLTSLKGWGLLVWSVCMHLAVMVGVLSTRVSCTHCTWPQVQWPEGSDLGRRLHCFKIVNVFWLATRAWCRLRLL